MISTSDAIYVALLVYYNVTNAVEIFVLHSVSFV